VVKFQAICNYFRNQKGVREGGNKTLKKTKSPSHKLRWKENMGKRIPSHKL
jgi:hypothetical protein